MDKQFLNNQNISILHEILLQELKIDNKSIWIPQIKQIFKNNISFFLANANFNNSLLELNKLFLKQTNIAINKLIPNLKNEHAKINILPDDINFLHKIEDIRNIKKDLFEEEFNLKKIEFDNTMKLEKPNAIIFLDNVQNEKILNMEQLLSDKILERNTQVENKSLEEIKSTNLINIDFDELISDDDILINEPINKNTSEIKNKNTSEIKNKNTSEPINKNTSEIKNKKVNFNLKEYDEIIPEIKTTTYEEQKSMELPKDDKISINHALVDNLKSPISNQFLPMNEFVKKINELNSKIDNLTQIVEQLHNLIKEKEYKETYV
jgi:hypothetical protein